MLLHKILLVSQIKEEEAERDRNGLRTLGPIVHWLTTGLLGLTLLSIISHVRIYVIRSLI
jgi:hypothetical protein